MSPRDEQTNDLDDLSGPRLVDQRQDDLVGRCLDGKFVLRELIGETPLVRVYRADQIALNRAVVIKVLRPVQGGDFDLTRRFHDEAFAVSRLFHPNAVTIYDYGHTRDGLLYIATEFLRGRSLGSLIRDGNTMPLMKIVDLVTQALLALEEAHAAGVIHADFTSENVIIEELKDGRQLVKVVDFGIAYLFQSSAHSTGPATPVIMAGSPEYMAPELISGKTPSQASDIYSAGVLLHELLTGGLPLANAPETRTTPTADGKIRLPDNDDTLEALQLGTENLEEHMVAGELEAIAQRAVASKPADRFPDVTSFRQAIAAAVANYVKSATCKQCGTQNEAKFRFCAECGQPLTSAGSSGADREIEAAKSEAKRVFADGDPEKAIDIMHQALGRAIRLGDRDVIIDCYQTLGRLLTETGASKKAINELEEAVDLVTAGGATETAIEVPESLWKIQLQLARLYHAVERQREALSMGSRALVSARQIASSDGRKSVQTFMTRLYAEVRQKAAPSVEKLSESDSPASDNELFSGQRSIQPFLDEHETSPWLLLDPDSLDDDDDDDDDDSD